MIAAPGKHLFLRLPDERLTFCHDGLSRDAQPDLVVFPCGHIHRFAEIKPDLPDNVLSRVASGAARVVFDASDEGLPHSPQASAILHGFLEHLGAPAGRAVYITQDRGFADDYLAHCAEVGARTPMTILNYDYWIKRLVHRYEASGERFFKRRRAAFRARGRSRPRRFLSLNRSPRPSKLIFLLRLIKDGLWDQGYISFGGLEQLERMKLGHIHRLMKTVRGLDGFADLAPELSPYLEQLAAKGVIDFKPAASELAPKGDDFHTGDAALPEYHQSWFSAVTESEMAARPLRVTEKVFKPLLNFHPFVVFGNPGSLAFLRGLGFESFPEMFDETYDTVADPRSRFEMAYAQVTRLCRMDEAELARLEAAVAEKVEHNGRVVLTQLPKVYRTEIDRGLVDQLLSGLV